MKRALERDVIWKQNANVENIINDLLSFQFKDERGIMSFEREIYKSLTNLEIKSLEKETTALNCLASQLKRTLKNFTTESIFKLCINFLTNDKTSNMIDFGRENELKWKLALTSKENRMKSLEKWTNLTNNINKEEGYEQSFITEDFLKMKNLKMTNVESINIEPKIIREIIFEEDDVFDKFIH